MFRFCAAAAWGALVAFLHSLAACVEDSLREASAVAVTPHAATSKTDATNVESAVSMVVLAALSVDRIDGPVLPRDVV